MPRPDSATWALPTHHDVLIREHGLDPTINPSVTCACGRVVLADVCIDIAGLPQPIRDALGLSAVEFLCDACCAVLYVHRYLGEEAMCALLGAPTTHVTAARQRDLGHALAMRARRLVQRSAHAMIDHTPFLPGASAASTALPALPATPIPHVRRRRTHADSALDLQRHGILAAPPQPLP